MSSPARGHAAVDQDVAEAGSQHLGWLLSRAHDYLVRDLRGERVGRVAALGYGADDRWPCTLVVRRPGVRGMMSLTTREVPFSEVLAVVPARREVRVVTAGPPRSASRTRGSGGRPARAPIAAGSPSRASTTETSSR